MVRVGTAEVNRFMRRATAELPNIDRTDAGVWANEVVRFYTDLLKESLSEEQALITKLLRWKWRAYKLSSGKSDTGGTTDQDSVRKRIPSG